MTPGCMHSTVRRSNGGGVVEQRRFLLSLHACLCVFEDNDTKRQARLCETYHKESQRMLWNQVEKEKKSRKRESQRKKERGRFWNQMESTGKKGEDGDIWVYMCGGQKTREKKKKETYG